MLYGTKKIKKSILTDAKIYAEEKELKLIFGAMVGSVSKGVHYPDSDYDTRFLYLRKDFPKKICIPSQMEEKELRYWYYPKDKIYEWIPFWEATSFLQFLVEPSFKNDFSIGLYNIVGWTFMSPYVWDPYGLQSKLLPLINMIFNGKYEIEYHKNLLNKYQMTFNEERVIAKNYFYAVHAAASIEWCIVFGAKPPINLQTLLYGIGRKGIWDEIHPILEYARRQTQDNFVYGVSKMHDSHFSILTSHNDKIEDYINWIEERTIERLVSDNSSDDERKKVVAKMYDIILYSINNNEKLLFGEG